MDYDLYDDYTDRSDRARAIDDDLIEWDPVTEPITRNVFELQLRDLVPQPTHSHKRRAAITINGKTIQETLRERLTRESRELEIAVTQLANQLAKRTEQLEHLKRFPETDPFEDGTVLQFEKSFPNTPDEKYSYVAHRVNSLWYLSGGRSPQGITWSAFVSWLGLGVDTVYQVGVGGRNGRRKVIG